MIAVFQKLNLRALIPELQLCFLAVWELHLGIFSFCSFSNFLPYLGRCGNSARAKTSSSNRCLLICVYPLEFLGSWFRPSQFTLTKLSCPAYEFQNWACKLQVVLEIWNIYQENFFEYMYIWFTVSDILNEAMQINFPLKGASNLWK